MLRWTIVPLLAGACTSFESLEEACKDDVPGDRDAAPGAVDVFQRLTCYRRYAGLGQARLSPAISRAVQNHVAYLEANVTLEDLASGVDPQREMGNRVGFTGDYPEDRMDEEGFETETSGLQTWSVFVGFEADADPALYIDREIHDPLFRDALLAPGWRAGSWARGTLGDEPGYAFGYLEAALNLPSGQAAFRPVAYPVDGQTGVPTDWINPYAIYNLPDAGQTVLEPWDKVPAVTGYPVSFTFGSDDTVGGRQNPLDVQMRKSSFLGPDGVPLEHLVVFPNEYFGGVNNSTLALIPIDPLTPNTTYTIEVDVSWVSREALTETISFTTSSTAGPGIQ